MSTRLSSWHAPDTNVPKPGFLGVLRSPAAGPAKIAGAITGAYLEESRGCPWSLPASGCHPPSCPLRPKAWKKSLPPPSLVRCHSSLPHCRQQEASKAIPTPPAINCKSPTSPTRYHFPLSRASFRQSGLCCPLPRGTWYPWLLGIPTLSG